jgi:hypothetical protein
MMNATGKNIVLALVGFALTACASSPTPAADSPQAVTPPSALQTLSLSSPLNRQLTSSGTTSFSAPSVGSDTLQSPEFPGYDLAEGNVAGSGGTSSTAGLGINRRLPGTKTGKAPGKSNGGQKPKARPVLGVSFDGLNLHDQRTANGGNQFTVEPPDQALCAGNGFVLESVNDVLKVYSTSGQAKTGVIDLNTFYRYPAAINRTTRTYGPSITDPICSYDAATQRWFHAVLTLDTNPNNGRLTGKNHLDIAVSQTADPTGQWNIFKLAVQDDGTQGTPVHPNCPCLGDYPHIGIDANGVYLTTNEFPFAGGFNGAQIYALSKQALVSGSSSVPLVQYDLSNSSIPAFTVWPATSPGQDFESGAGGTEYFLSSLAVFSNDGTSNQLAVWGLSNTQSLKGSPRLTLNAQTVNVETYAVPPLADQKQGDFPLGQCLNKASCAPTLLGGTDPYAPEAISPLDGNDSRMQQVTYANGKLWGALDTAVNDNGKDRVGIEWYVLKPQVTPTSVSASVALQGTLSVPGNSVTRPALAVTESGRGVMGFTLVGQDHFPSAGYTGMDAKIGAGNVEVAAEGAGPQDGFSGYKAYGNPPRPRWGDYAAAATDGKTIWIANEYIAQTCTLDQYTAAPFGTCGGTRVALGNWGTRISAVTP